jgi:hypothetical protein
VTQGTREPGIRIALGAQRMRLMAMVLRQAGGMLMAGLATGLLLAYPTSRVVGTLLYGLKQHDPWTMAAMTLILFMGGLAAACSLRGGRQALIRWRLCAASKPNLFKRVTHLRNHARVLGQNGGFIRRSIRRARYD